MIPHRQVILESVGRGPQSLPQIACALHLRANIRTSDMYVVARSEVRTMTDDGLLEMVGEGLNTCWRLPAKGT